MDVDWSRAPRVGRHRVSERTPHPRRRSRLQPDHRPMATPGPGSALLEVVPDDGLGRRSRHRGRRKRTERPGCRVGATGDRSSRIPAVTRARGRSRLPRQSTPPGAPFAPSWSCSRSRMRRRRMLFVVLVIIDESSKFHRRDAHYDNHDRAPCRDAVERVDGQPLLYEGGLARVSDGWMDGWMNGWIFSGTRWLAHTDDALHRTSLNEHAIPPEWSARGYNHVGDIDVVGEVLYAPYDRPNYSLGHQATASRKWKRSSRAPRSGPRRPR
jgi:hypothetical protein